MDYWWKRIEIQSWIYWKMSFNNVVLSSEKISVGGKFQHFADLFSPLIRKWYSIEVIQFWGKSYELENIITKVELDCFGILNIVTRIYSYFLNTWNFCNFLRKKFTLSWKNENFLHFFILNSKKFWKTKNIKPEHFGVLLIRLKKYLFTNFQVC